ncbi:MAG: hypothetical protein AABX69_02760, partial [Nanoarchaeota archaeon]
MNDFCIFKTREFDEDFSKLDNSERQRVEKTLLQLLQHGGEVGKPLSGLPFFKEKKFNGKRLYFLVYENLHVVLVLAISDKKAQRATINMILRDLGVYQQYVLDELKKRL